MQPLHISLIFLDPYVFLLLTVIFPLSTQRPPPPPPHPLAPPPFGPPPHLRPPQPAMLGGGCGYPGSSVNTKVFLKAPSNVVANGAVHFPIPVGTTAVYSCETPYIILGETRRTCRPDATWSGTMPFCGLNVAMHKPLLLPVLRNAWLTNDGIISTRARDCFSHDLQRGATLTWKMDLTEPFDVHSIRILALADLPWSANVTLFSDPLTIVTCGRIDYNGLDQTAAVSVPCAAVTPGVRFVQLDFSLLDAGRLRICEVNVLAVDALTSDLCPHEASAKAVHQGGCLSFHSHGRATWGGALQTCRRLGGTLIQDIEEDGHKFLQSKLQYLHRFQPSDAFYWLGLFRSVNMTTMQDLWQWTHGSIPSAYFWAPDQPDPVSKRQYCGGMSGRSTWLWNDLNCESGQGFWICRTNFTSCPIPEQPANGIISLLDRRLGGLVHYKCEEGFEMLGLGTRSCLSSGAWSGTLPHCITTWSATQPAVETRPTTATRVTPATVVTQTETALAPRDSPPDTPVTQYLSTFAETTTETSSSGETPVMVEVSTDLDDFMKDLSNADAEMPNTTLPMLPITEYSFDTLESDSTNETENVTQTSFFPASEEVLVTSTAVSPESSPKVHHIHMLTESPATSPKSAAILDAFAVMRCRNVPILFNGQSTMEMMGLIVVARYTCNQGYNLVGLPFLTCTDGFWRGVMPLCVRGYANEEETTTASTTTKPAEITEPATFPTTIEAVTEVTSTTDSPTTQTTRSAERAVPSTAAMKIFANTTFTTARPSTTTEIPEIKTEPSETTQTTSPTTESSTSTTKKPERVTWSESGTTAPSRRSCGPIPVVPHAQSLMHRNTAIYRCIPGYTMVGENVTQCLDSDEWETPPECLAVDCGLPEKLKNGITILLNGTSTLGSSAAYTCNDANLSHPPYLRVCGEDGQWEGPIPQCATENPVVLPAESRQLVQPGMANWMIIVIGVAGTVGGVLVVLAAVFSCRWMSRKRESVPVAISPTLYSLNSGNSPHNLMTERSSARLFDRAHYMPSSASYHSAGESTQSISDASTQTGRFNNANSM